MDLQVTNPEISNTTLILTLANFHLTAGSDFIGITGLPVIFDPTTNFIVIQVSIMDDNALEVSPEDFTAILTSVVPRLTLLPDVARVNILDDDRKQFYSTVTMLGGYSSSPVILSSCDIWIFCWPIQCQ